MATVRLEEQKSSLILQSNFGAFKPRNTKRKRTDRDETVSKRKIVASSADRNDSDDEERLSLSPRVPPIITKSSNTSSRSMQAMALFRCQLCRRWLRSKDLYMEHMMKCAIQRQAAIRIVRGDKDKEEVAMV